MSFHKGALRFFSRCACSARLDSTQNFLLYHSKLKPAITHIFRNHSKKIKRCYAVRTCAAVRELTRVPKPASGTETTGIQDNVDGIPSRITFVMKTLSGLYDEPEEELLPVCMDKTKRKEHATVPRLMVAARAFPKIIAVDVKECYLGKAGILGVCLVLYLDPRTTSCGPKTCISVGETTKDRGVNKFKQQAPYLVNNNDPASFHVANPHSIVLACDRPP